MKLTEHYLHLRNHFGDTLENEDFTITIDELANILCCSPRYTKKIMKEMHLEKWIHWKVTYGRGKRPTLTFLKNKGEVLLEVSKSHIQSGRYKEGLQLLHSLGPHYQEKANEWLVNQFGYIEENDKNEPLEVLRYPYYFSIIHLDPAHINSIHENHLVDHIFDTLLVYNPETKSADPHLAHHYECSDEGMTWRFYLRKGVFFHHGRELTAQDVVQSFQRLKEIAFSNKSMISNIKAIEANKKWVVEFHLSQTDYLFPHALCHKQLSIIPIDVYRNLGEAFTTLPTGTGPFKITKHDESMIRLDAHGTYFKGRPHLDRVEIITLDEINQDTKRGFADYFSHDVSANNTPMYWEEVHQPEEGATYITFNLFKDGPHQSKKLREAINLCIDRDALCQFLGGKHLFPADSQLINETAKTYVNAYNPAKSMALLHEAGYSGETLTLYATQLRKNASVQTEAFWIKEQCEKVGIKVDVHVIPIPELLKQSTMKKADMIIGGFAFGNDIVYSFYRFFQIPGSFVKNLMGKKLGAILDQQILNVRQEADTNKQMSYLLDLEHTIKKEVAIINLYHRSHAINVNNNSQLKGISLEWFGRVNYKDLWFK
ncbi:ABC transporter substrate-binding protein [Evansella cellulosilytica]|uniref:Extracellular solute-binding protein family 5 n=1 Tax=Evansella cellulosilytica (strain ATCC 21833 / DSM 2522 / FERM P-1141 / JCM 9156 / N-4) TaxID=649639 RepID=E6TQF3_EVAC2|nr:ABC transporter substrate-binding protein [Evansella cellulosilytica]ADU29331.1 extracellular solute-binding protein family 5 [Evansella cellulosilytica DSM 2522]